MKDTVRQSWSRRQKNGGQDALRNTSTHLPKSEKYSTVEIREEANIYQDLGTTRNRRYDLSQDVVEKRPPTSSVPKFRGIYNGAVQGYGPYSQVIFPGCLQLDVQDFPVRTATQKAWNSCMFNNFKPFPLLHYCQLSPWHLPTIRRMYTILRSCRWECPEVAVDAVPFLLFLVLSC